MDEHFILLYHYVWHSVFRIGMQSVDECPRFHKPNEGQLHHHRDCDTEARQYIDGTRMGRGTAKI